MSISLLKNVFGPWEQVRGNVAKDLEHIQTYLNRLDGNPDFLPPRSEVISSSAVPTINTDEVDFFVISLLSEAVQSFTMNLQGSPTDGQTLSIRILDNGTPRSLTWGLKFASRRATLPVTTVASTYLYISLIYNEITSTWDCLGSVLVAADIPNLDASKITTGTLADARLSANVPLYSSGAWTPIFNGSGGGTPSTYGLNAGRYIKIGKLVFVQGRITITTKGTITANLQIQGLPFASSAATGLSTLQFGYFASMSTNLLFMGANVNASATSATVYGTVAASTGGVSVLTTADVSNTTDVIFSGTYESA